MHKTTWIKIGGSIVFCAGLGLLIAGCVVGVTPFIIGGLALFMAGSLVNLFANRA